MDVERDLTDNKQYFEITHFKIFFVVNQGFDFVFDHSIIGNKKY